MLHTNELMIDLSRLQFALTALYHFLFVPLTLGLSIMLAVMETVYVMTKKPIWKKMTQFWGVLFGINFAIGVSTGITMEFQFGTNWAYYSQYVGDIFGAPLAIEGLMAFFLEASFVGLFFFGWNKLSPLKHMTVTWLVALGTNFSALWILIANGWMQNPVGTAFNVDTMRMEITDFAAILLNPVAQAKFVHTVAAGYLTAATFVLGISAHYLLKGKHSALAKRSIAVAASFGLAAALSVIVLGDESGYETHDHQKMKLAAIESMWETEPAPASFTIIGWPNQATRTTDYAIRIPWLMGLIGTRSLNTPIPGIDQLVQRAIPKIQRGLVAYRALEYLKKYPKNQRARLTLKQHEHYLGYAFLLKRFISDPLKASQKDIYRAAWSLVPDVAPIFFSFRIMVGCAFTLLCLFIAAFYFASRHQFNRPTFLKLARWSIALPYMAVLTGWFVAEYGRQPWIINGVLPTFDAVSSLTLTDVILTISGFVLIYSILAVIEVKLMLKAIAKGPAETEGATS